MNDGISSLCGLGPKSAKMLIEAGIKTPEQIHQLGAAACFVKVKQHDPKASLNLLWALESAITNEPWQIVARKKRLELLVAVDVLSKQSKQSLTTFNK